LSYGRATSSSVHAELCPINPATRVDDVKAEPTSGSADRHVPRDHGHHHCQLVPPWAVLRSR